MALEYNWYEKGDTTEIFWMGIRYPITIEVPGYYYQTCDRIELLVRENRDDETDYQSRDDAGSESSLWQDYV